MICSGVRLNAVCCAILIKSVRKRWTLKYAPHIRAKLDGRTHVTAVLVFFFGCLPLDFLDEVSKPA